MRQLSYRKVIATPLLLLSFISCGGNYDSNNSKPSPAELDTSESVYENIDAMSLDTTTDDLPETSLPTNSHAPNDSDLDGLSEHSGRIKNSGPVETEQPPPSPQQQIPDHLKAVTVRIFNSTSDIVNITIGPRGQMRQVAIAGSVNWLSPTYSTDPTIRIIGRRSTIAYDLELGKDYFLFWNRQTQDFDLKKNRGT